MQLAGKSYLGCVVIVEDLVGFVKNEISQRPLLHATAFLLHCTQLIICTWLSSQNEEMSIAAQVSGAGLG